MSARLFVLVAAGFVLAAPKAPADDWPQWRGPNRDAKVTGFAAPATWPKALTQKWKVTVGDGVATPALVGDRLYVFSRQQDNEVVRCLDAATGKEQWQDKYPSAGASGPASGYSGPRGSPAVADGKVVTHGVRGILTCYDAATGQKLWRKDGSGGPLPQFSTASSPVVVNGLCVVQVGGESQGGIAAYDLATGDEKWKWAGDGSAYASPVLLTVDGAPTIVAETAGNVVGVSADGKLLWKTPFPKGGGRTYNACTPVLDDQTVIFSGANRGTKAVKLEKGGDAIAVKELWNNPQTAVQYNTPVLKDGLVYGITDRGSLFCLNAQTGKTAWTAPLPTKSRRDLGYGSVIDAGPVLMALTPAAELIVFQPGDKEFKQVASYKVSDDGDAYAYPVLAGNRVFVKDKNAVTLWSLE
jgi:outer membrane protein assembly factor BamB